MQEHVSLNRINYILVTEKILFFLPWCEIVNQGVTWRHVVIRTLKMYKNGNMRVNRAAWD